MGVSLAIYDWTRYPFEWQKILTSFHLLTPQWFRTAKNQNVLNHTVNLIAPPCLLCSWAPLQSSSRSLAPKLVGKWKLYVLKRPGFVPQCTPESLTLRDVRGEQGCRVFITDKFSWGQISFHLKCEEITSVFFFQLPRIRSVELDRKPELQIACTVKPDMKENTEWQENQSA